MAISAQHIVNRIDRAIDAIDRMLVVGRHGDQAHPAAKPGALLTRLSAGDWQSMRDRKHPLVMQRDRLMKQRGPAQDLLWSEQAKAAEAAERAERAAARKRAAAYRKARAKQCPTCGAYAMAARESKRPIPMRPTPSIRPGSHRPPATRQPPIASTI